MKKTLTIELEEYQNLVKNLEAYKGNSYYYYDRHLYADGRFSHGCITGLSKEGLKIEAVMQLRENEDVIKKLNNKITDLENENFNLRLEVINLKSKSFFKRILNIK